ncbi:hypothetical protein KP509_08G050200 [Ceratopteris richardii]|nr:hypothetical protein KP509_08G050200 [Ceratopteris richardii]
MRGDIHVTRQEAGDLELLPNWEGSGEFNITENGSPTGKTKTNVQQMHGKGDENEARDTYEMWSESFAEAFEAMDTDLRMHPTIDCFCSGTTSVTVIKQGEDLVIGNVGDSRAVLATLSHDSTLEAIQLTVDLKPSVPKEAERILKCNGRVFALEDEPEVARVWLPFDDAPGLAMARAFGDFCLKDFGLISEPEVTHHKLSPNDQFVVLATDGVWDVLSNKEVVEVVSSAPTRATAARSLVETAVRAWRLKYPNSKVDDCAVVCLYLHPPKPRTGKWSFSRDPGPSEGEQKSTNGGESGKEIAQCEAYEGRTEDFKCAEDGSLGRSNTVRNASDPEILNDAEKERREDMDGGKASIPDGERPPLSKSIGDCLTADDDDEWSALEGVVRVNSLLTLPRFVKGDKRGGPSKPT